MLSRYNAILIPARKLDLTHLTDVLCCCTKVTNLISNARYLIGCDSVEHLSIVVNGKQFDMWVDEEGKLKYLPETLWLEWYQDIIFGNILITKGADTIENLTEEDITDIQQWVHICRFDLTNHI